MIVEAVVLTKKTCAFPFDSVSWADIDTFATADTFLVADFLYVHLTVIYTEVTIYTFVFFHFYAEEGELVKQSVQCTEWTKETTEESEDEYTSDHDTYHEEELPSEDWSEHGEVACVYFV